MSEHAIGHSPEHAPRHDQTEHEPKQSEVHRQHTGETQHHRVDHKIDELQRQVEQLALSGKEHTPATTESKNHHHPLQVNRELKAVALHRTLLRVRRRMNAPDKVMSRIVHQPALEKLSDAGSNTIARPSGILGGGLVAFIGSLALYLMSRHYGYSYNFGVMIILFISGFFIGMMAELGLRALRHQRR